MFSEKIIKSLNIKEEELANIKNVIFDLGGVVINIHYEATVEAFKKLGFPFEEMFTQFKQTPFFDEFETGKTPPSAFRNYLRTYKSAITDAQIDESWNAMIGIMPRENVDIIKKVRTRYRTFLLSNTNPINIDYFMSYMKKEFGSNQFPEMFEQAWYSHDIGERKPNMSAYHKVLGLAGLKASETLFIDDLAANIEGARKAGLHAHHLHNHTIGDIFDFN